MSWSATITNVEYHKPIYRCTVLMKKDDVDMGEEIMEIKDTSEQADVEDTMRDMIEAKEEAESLGAALNDMIGVEITG